MSGNSIKKKKILSVAVLAVIIIVVLIFLFGRRTLTQKSSGPIGEGSCNATISIGCATILDNMNQLEEDKRELVPEDGVLLAETKVRFNPGESVFDVLLKATKDRKLHLEFEESPMYGSTYIEGIGNLYEFDCGALSGWMYSVNGEFPMFGCSEYELRDGDVIEFVYTCDMGADVGNVFEME